MPVNVSDYVTRKIDIPAGKKPAVMTFDDGSETQLQLSADGVVDPDTAVGIMLDFAEAHPDFRPAGTFYVNRDPFGPAPTRRGSSSGSTTTGSRSATTRPTTET